jgi:hypothetical protein
MGSRRTEVYLVGARLSHIYLNHSHDFLLQSRGKLIHKLLLFVGHYASSAMGADYYGEPSENVPTTSLTYLAKRTRIEPKGTRIGSSRINSVYIHHLGMSSDQYFAWTKRRRAIELIFPSAYYFI